jgi:ABC-type transport system substrate-binding protein
VPTRRPLAAVLFAAVLAAAACDAGPVITDPPARGVATPVPSEAATPAASEVPFTPASWPRTGSACGTPGYGGTLGRIEAVNARTVRFTLCKPDGAFLARLAHPALSVLDTASVERLAADRSAATRLAGTGPYRIDAWVPGDNVRLFRVAGEATPAARVSTIVLRWARDPTQRTIGLQSATVDGIDEPGPLDLERIATQPELSVSPRDGMATAYLAFGSGPAFAKSGVRRALAQAFDRDALATDAFPPGSTAPSHVAPCAIAGACGGADWYAFNAPAAAAALAAATFDLTRTYPLHFPEAPVPGLPDPHGIAAAVQAQLDESVGMQVKLDPMPVREYAAGLASGKLDGLYLGGVASTVADPGAFLGPLFATGLHSTPAGRAPAIGRAIADASATADPAERADAFGRANDAIRAGAVIVPLAHPGSTAAFRSDVTGVVTSPLGLDPLGSFSPGDRGQLVFMQATEPQGAYCADQATGDAFRLCGLVLEGLYGFAPGSLAPEPRLAERCDPDADAITWTCRLRSGVTFHDGARLDAGDVLASFVAQWDRSQPMRAGSDAPFTAWTALFGDTLGGR